MDDSAVLAGFIAAHAIWSICKGETLIPIYAFVDEGGARRMERFEHARPEVNVAAGKARLEEPAATTRAKVLVFDGRIARDDGRMDALIVEWRGYVKTPGVAILALPYTPSVKGGLFRRARRFAVHRPKLFSISEEWKEHTPAVLKKFFEGVARHEHGSRVWNEHLDKSA